MNKSTTISFLKKIMLNGLADQAKIQITENSLKCSFTTINKDVVGNIELKTPTNSKGEVGIINLPSLISLLSLMQEDINLELINQGDVSKLMILKDDKFTHQYPLADLRVIKKIPQVQNYNRDIISTFDSSLGKNIIDCQKATGASVLILSPNTDTKTLKCIVGENNRYTLKTEFTTSISYEGFPMADLKFGINPFVEIFKNNKTEGSVEIDEEGLINLSFVDGPITSNYILIATE